MARPAETLNTTVFIAGAGMAGIGAASTLSDNGIDDFIIAEAKDDVGGRMESMSFGDKANEPGANYTVEIGAGWIFGTTGNPMWDLKERVDMKGQFEDFYPVYVYDPFGKGKLVTESRYQPFSQCAKMDEAHNTAGEISLKCLQPGADEKLDADSQAFCDTYLGPDFKPEDFDDISLADLEALLGFDPSTIEDPTQRAVARVCQVYYDDDYHGENPSLVSVNNTLPYRYGDDFGGPTHYWIGDDRGYKFLAKRKAADFLHATVTSDEIDLQDQRLILGKKVVKVEWDPEGKQDVAITLCETEQVKKDDSPILYPCKTQGNNKPILTKVNAKQFISTFSIGILKKSIDLEMDATSVEDSYDVAPRFDPPLHTDAAELANALAHTGMGDYAQVLFQFEHYFWPKDRPMFLSAFTPDSAQEKYLGDYAPFWMNRDGNVKGKSGRFYEGSKYLNVYMQGERAREATFKSDETMKEEMVEVLNGMFAFKINRLYGRPLEAADIKHFYMSRWHINPLSYGVFSLNKIGFTTADQQNMSKCHGNICISGEATCGRHPGFTHGGLLSGERTARQLMKEFDYVPDISTESSCDVSIRSLLE